LIVSDFDTFLGQFSNSGIKVKIAFKKT